MSTDGQLNDTRGYHIKPTNSTCNMISCFHRKPTCSFVRGNLFMSAQSNLNDCRKALSMKIIWINMNKNIRKNPCCVGSLLEYICCLSALNRLQTVVRGHFGRKSRVQVSVLFDDNWQLFRKKTKRINKFHIYMYTISIESTFYVLLWLP